MLRAIQRAVLRYVLLAAAGTVLVLLGVPLGKYASVKSGIADAAALRAASRHAEALRKLGELDSWAAPYPALWFLVQCERIRCLARGGNVPSAESLAEDVLRQRLPEAAARDWAARVQGPGYALANRTLAVRDARALTPWSGYHALIEELRAASNPQPLQVAISALLARHPSNPVVTVQKASPRAATASRPQAPNRDAAQPASPPDNSPAQWAAVKAEEGRFYDRKGKFLGKTLCGFPVSISQVLPTTGGDVALCTAAVPTNLPPEFVMKTEDLEIRSGAYARASVEERDLVTRKAALLGQSARARREAAETARGKNPYAAQYDRVLASQRAFAAKVKDLTAKRDAAEGEPRMRYGDELRAMIGQNAEMNNEFKAVKERYGAWEREHPQSAPPAALPASDPLQTEIARLDEALQRLEPRP
jgi:hypothetical protein